jgi:predicted protein tyrosine phosphatase
VRHVLFICSRNQLRSPTAETVFSVWPGIEVASAGLDPKCKEPVTPELLAWDRGGALVMRPLILHASSKATSLSQRRVLHFVFGPPRLPLGLEWRWAGPLQSLESL